MADESAVLHPPAQTIHGSIPSGAAESQPTATHVEVEMSVDSTGRRGGVLLLTLGLYLLSAGIAHAQFRAAIQGTVTDASGGAMPGATIVV